MGTGCSDLGYEIPVVTAIVPPSLVWQEFGISLQREVILERDMTTRPRRDVVARLVSKKRSSYKEESSESSSESSEEEVVQLPDVEDRSYEQVQEGAALCLPWELLLRAGSTLASQLCQSGVWVRGVWCGVCDLWELC